MLFAALAWLGAADATEISAADLRGLAAAIYFFSVNFFAFVIGINLIGKLNDLLGATNDLQMMRYALLVFPVSCALAVLCLLAGGRALQKSEIK